MSTSGSSVKHTQIMGMKSDNMLEIPRPLAMVQPGQPLYEAHPTLAPRQGLHASPIPSNVVSGDPLTHSNLAKHDRQLAQLYSAAGVGSSLFYADPFVFSKPARSVGVDPFSPSFKAAMPHPQGMLPMERFLYTRDDKLVGDCRGGSS